MKTVLIVEAPKKVKTLSTLLGPDYIVIPTAGHIKDLPPKQLGVNILDGFKPTYVPLEGKTNIITNIIRHKAHPIFICTDADREGERIGAHVAEILGIPLNLQKRITYRNLSYAEVSTALKNPRAFDPALLDAQEARRVIDRIMGFMTSRWLWSMGNTIKVRLVAAGRVQSAVLNIITQREEEIRAFKPETYFLFKLRDKRDLMPKKDRERGEFEATQVQKVNGTIEEVKYRSLLELTQAIEKFKQSPEPLTIKETKEKLELIQPPPPLITSSMIKAASTELGWTPAKITQIAQELYAAGHITYIRTDNPNVSADFVAIAKPYYASKGWEPLLADQIKVFKAPEGAQEAHEAIRPVTMVEKPPGLSPDEQSLYQIIFKRALLCLAKPAVVKKQTVLLSRGPFLFRAYLQEVQSPGWWTIRGKPDAAIKLPELHYLLAVQSPVTTKPPSRFTVSTLTEEMERLEIGRPSTYAAVFTTLERHAYIKYTKQMSIQPTEPGEMVTHLLRKHFAKFIAADYTREMEIRLDRIAKGEESRETVLTEWYHEFNTAYTAATAASEAISKAAPKFNPIT
jgi:DNA topoisomerase-1